HAHRRPLIDRSRTDVSQTVLLTDPRAGHHRRDAAIRADHHITGDQVAAVTLEVFQGAYDFAGGGIYGDKDHPRTKEQADYNLKYLSAVALLDGQVGPEQLETERVLRADVQDLLSRVDVKAAPDLTAEYPERTAARVHVVLHDGQTLSLEQSDFEGSPTRPMSWERVVEKFDWLAEPFVDEALGAEIVASVENLDRISVSELADLLSAVSPTPKRARTRGRL